MQFDLHDARRYSQKFLRSLQNPNPDPVRRQWIFVPYDQLSDELGPLGVEEPGQLGVVLIENHAMLRCCGHGNLLLTWLSG